MKPIKRLLPHNGSLPIKRFGQVLFGHALWMTGLLSLPMPASAHIILDPNGSTPPRNTGGVSCGTPSDSPAVFAPGSRISVDYIVQVKHGDTIRIDFAEAGDQGFSEHVLAEFASHYGAGEKTVTLPDIECDACTLRIRETGYTSCADIRLQNPDPMPTDNTPPMPIAVAPAKINADSVTLSWQNPAADYAETLWLMSYSPLTATPEAGHMYIEGELLGDAKVVYVGDGTEHQLTGLLAAAEVYFAGFARDEAGNYSQPAQISATTGDAVPEPLALNVVVMQNNRLLTMTDGTFWLASGAGDVLVQAQASQPDTSTITWQVTDMQLMNIATATATDEYIFDAAMLSAGQYSLVVTAETDDEAVQQSIQLAVAEPMADSSVSKEGGRESAQTAAGGAGDKLWLLAIALLMTGRWLASLLRREVVR